MALKLSVAQAREADKGNPFPGLTGKVKVVFGQKQKESKNPNAAPGSTYLDQGVVLCDVSDPKQEIVVSFYDRAEFGKDITGKIMEITPGPKGGLKSNGSYEKEYNGQSQTVYTATVTAACDVTIGGAARQAAPAAQRPATGPAQQPGQPRPAAAPAPAARTAAPVGTVSWEEFLQIEAHIMEMCIGSALGIAEKVHTNVEAHCGVGLDPSNIVELAIGLRVGAGKHGLTHDTRLRMQQAKTIHPPAEAHQEDPGQQPVAEDDVPF